MVAPANIHTASRLRRLACYISLLLVSSSTPLSAAGTPEPGAPPLTVALDRAWHPLSYLDDNGRPQGVLIDYWRLIAKRMDRPIRFELVDWQQSLDLVREGRADVHGGLFQSPDRNTYLAFSNPLIPLSTRLFVSAKLNARTLTDLARIPVGITRGGYEVEFVRQTSPGTELAFYPNNARLVQAALEEDVLAFVADYPVGMFYLHRYGSPEKFRVTHTLYSNTLKAGVASGNHALLLSIDSALGDITRDEKDVILQKWMRTETVAPVWLLPSLIGALIVILLGGGIGYTLLLRMQVAHKTDRLQQEVDESVRLRHANAELMEQLLQQKNEAERANIAKSKFLAAASHDLRQPLQALTLFTAALDELISYPKARHIVDQINASADALQNLFNALLDISRLDAGVMPVHKSAVDVADLLEKLANDYQPQAAKKGLVFIVRTCNAVVVSDAMLLERVVRNLLSNAVRYTERGTITITCECGRDQVRVHIRDTGPGIPPTEQQAVFNEFHQLGNPERDRNKGLGLGLAIVKRTARLLGHDIELHSTPGAGSVFSVIIQRADVDQLAAVQPASEPAWAAPEGTLFVVIDDEVSVLEATRCLLESWQCDVITATDIDQALLATRKTDTIPAGIIADYRLRRHETGIEAIAALRTAFDHPIPAIVVTGDTAVDRLRDVVGSGFDILHKPVPPARLRAFVRHAQQASGSASARGNGDTDLL